MSAPDESTKDLWRSEDVAADTKRCTEGSPTYAGLLACSCVAGARLGAAKAVPADDERTKQSLMDSSRRICQRLSVKYAELDGQEAESNYRVFGQLIELAKIESAEKAG